MPIVCSVEILGMDQERFHEMDRLVMRRVFEIHNTLGRFCDERIYQDELATRCREDGLACHREAGIRVTLRDFSKTYLLDLLVEASSIYELKACHHLSQTHQSQLINYLFLSGSKHGKLLNFRPASVESRFVSSTLTKAERHNYSLIQDQFDQSPACDQLLSTLLELVNEWGAFLDTNLYRDALLHFLSGPDSGLQPMNIELNGRIVGTQKMCLLDPESAWHLSTIKTALKSHETHIRRLIRHTRLKRIHWINLNQRNITLKTIQK
jgi:GxxExxY protein